MVMDNHAECKNALLGLLAALRRIKKLAEDGPGSGDVLAAIHRLTSYAVEWHSPILPTFQ